MTVLKSAAHGVFHAAGLGAHAAIAAAAAYKRRHIALPRMAEAQRSVDEYLRFYRRMLCYELYLLETQLARKDCTGESHLGRCLNAGKVMDAHLGARVQRNIRHGFFQNAQEPEILHKDGVRAEIRYAPGKLDGLLHLPVADERVHRDIDFAVAYAAVSDRLFKLLVAEIFCSASSVEYSKSHIHRIRAVLNGGNDRLRRACGRKQLKHISIPLAFYFYR